MMFKEFSNKKTPVPFLGGLARKLDIMYASTL